MAARRGQGRKNGAGVPLVASHADYRRPSRVHDTLTIESLVSRCGRSSFTIGHIFRRGDELIPDGREKRVWC
jgi:acyl-CoA thioesterase FadM